MRFGEPLYLYFLWSLIPIIFLMIWGRKKKQQLIVKFCGDPLLSKLIYPDLEKRQRTQAIFLFLAILLFLIASTSPRWGYHWEDLHQRGVDVIVALDVSNSMLAEDMKPNRLERAKRKISDLLDMLEGDRIGLVAFAGTSFVQCPLTLDYNAARLFLSAIDTELIPVQGTAIGNAIKTSAKAFRTQEKKSKALILITDGEDQTGQALAAAKEAQKQGVKIYAIGIGGEIGAPLPNPSNQGGFRKNQQGEIILSKLDETTLQKIALETGGSYVRSVTGDIDLKTIYADQIKKRIEKKEFKSERRKIWQERFQWFIFAGLIFLTLDTYLTARKPKARP
ncbi:MAG: VWA domain-containing protein [Nitrospinaceae bacterium]|nr:VWA domain-containing protein [Nitrospina sp.]MBT5868434.1 VWA domain-containing protein [Nitrospinaceae bacterium]MBT6347376.1 VWA domain-containing protein [Nitrospina sp.]